MYRLHFITLFDDDDESAKDELEMLESSVPGIRF